MRKFMSACLLLIAFQGKLSAQTVSTFDDLSLPTSDTFYINTANPLTDMGFTDGLAYFSYFYDTSYGGFWSSGFLYSNKTDSVTSGYTNMYSAKAGSGYAGSLKYAVATTNLSTIKVHISGIAKGNPVKGFYVTNNTYAYNAMRDGYFNAKKFGGPTGNDSDWFKLTIKAFYHGVLGSDSVDFYLADYRSANKYIIKDWTWVNLLPLGNADSLTFTLSSSDTAGGNGMNTPAFFCMDNFTTDETAGLSRVTAAAFVKVYPIPAEDHLYIDNVAGAFRTAEILDLSGKPLMNVTLLNTKNDIRLAALPPATYCLKLEGDKGNSITRFVKK